MPVVTLKLCKLGTAVTCPTVILLDVVDAVNGTIENKSLSCIHCQPSFWMYRMVEMLSARSVA